MPSETPLPIRDLSIVISGGARRLGAAMARYLHAAGANILIHHRASSREATALVAELNHRREKSAALHRGDLLDPATPTRIVTATVEAFGGIDVLINNASTFYPTPLGSISAEAFDDLIGTNLRAPLFLSQAAAPELARRQGSILNLIDIPAFRPLKNHTVYCMAKAGLVMLTQSLARELGPAIRVNGIAPGPVLWPDGGIDPAIQAQILERTALKRLGSPEDIAKAALFLIKDAPFITGQILPVDGGRSAGGF
jgi:pteridine reductase